MRKKVVLKLILDSPCQVPMAEAMEKFTLDFNCRTILIDVVREIDRVDVKEMSRDTSGTRAFSQFLVEVAERLPEQLQPCLVLLMKHLVFFNLFFAIGMLYNAPYQQIILYINLG
jgi:hypothetical protein